MLGGILKLTVILSALFLFVTLLSQVTTVDASPVNVYMLNYYRKLSYAHTIVLLFDKEKMIDKIDCFEN
jgi:hypothetical protein